MIRQSRRGFTMLVAITCLALVGVALALLGGLVTDDARRTGREVAELQQRQLLLAGLRWVESHLSADEASVVVGGLATPAELEASLSVDAVERPTPQRIVVTIRATFGTGTLGERATFDRSPAAWQLSRVEIER